MSGYQEHPLIAEIYDTIPSHQNRPDVAFYTRLATESNGPVLELASGTGRILIAIAKSGKPISGLEASEHMLSRCREALERAPQDLRGEVELVQGRMQSFHLEDRFGLVICPFNSFLHLLSVEEQLSCLDCVHEHLEPGGRFAFDVFEPDIPRMASPRFTEEGQPQRFELSTGVTIELRHRNKSVDFRSQMIEGELILDVTHPNGRNEQALHPFQQRYLFRNEAEHLLDRCGFGVEAVYGDFDENPHGTSGPGPFVFVARKR